MRRSMAPRRLFMTWVLVVCAAGPVQAGRFDSRPVSLRIDGYVGPKPEGLVMEATWTVRVQGKDLTMQVAKLEVLTGNVSYFDIISAVEPYTYAFSVFGDDAALKTLTQATPGRKFTMVANTQLSQLPGLLFISSIALVPEATPAVSPAAEG